MKIGITQRVVLSGTETRDALDQAWNPFLEGCGFQMIPIPTLVSDPEAFLKKLNIEGVLLTGGNNISPASFSMLHPQTKQKLIELGDVSLQRDALEKKILDISVKKNYPVLGVCRGMQILNLYHGGNLSIVPGHVGINHVIHNHSPVSLDPSVNSSHNFGIHAQDVAPAFDIWATAMDHTVEAFKHKKFPHVGIMWHPERKPFLLTSHITLFKQVFGNYQL